MSRDDETLAAYDAKVADYAKLLEGYEFTGLAEFLDALPATAFVLDLGCGTGEASAVIAREGHRVDAVDGSPAMVAHVRKAHGLEAREALFGDIVGDDLYDGIWANFSLLHAPKAEMPDHLALLARALKPGGIFHIAMKIGSGEKRDSIGRLYAYYGEEELETLMQDAGLTPLARRHGEDVGLAGTPEPWVVIRARG